MADKEKSGDEEEPTIAEDLVVTKYKMAGEIVNRILKEVIKKCEAGKGVREICEWGDAQLMEETAKVFKKEKEMKKGIAFPTCLSVNNCICHFSPLENEPDVVLQEGDVVKVDLGAHIDGFSAVVAHTFVVGATKDAKVKGRKADAILAAYNASEAALRLLRPGNTNNQITEMVSKVAEQYECKPIEGMLSHRIERNKIDGGKSIIQNPTESQRKEHEKAEFDVHEGREMESKVNIFKKTEETYMLKLKASRGFYSDVEKRFGLMPFNIRLLEDEKKARMGLVECVKHKLVDPFQVLYEKRELYESEHKIKDNEISSLLHKAVNEKSAKRNKKKKSGKSAGGDGPKAEPEITPPTSVSANGEPVAVVAES
ncbi:unnamed protein product [Cyprideis torosa]|uniref:Peptidase M24 domain-containing protein n=1 Tax=Cyprideis torosa TaxID=163714 RepID=A0A7R8ZKI6_9CRUS|nr:unnamed protein product [Cyprideis torosa]CAG0891028.1 unnamed protein product [Cyprideis torosa]